MRCSLSWWAVVLGLSCSIAGCKALFQRHDAADTDAGAAPAPAASGDDSIPTPQDFEEEAVQKITPSNFRSELALLRKEIGTK